MRIGQKTRRELDLTQSKESFAKPDIF